MIICCLATQFGFRAHNAIPVERGATSDAHDVIAITSPQKNNLCTEELRDRAKLLDEVGLPLTKGEAVFSPNPMWYRPIWSCDFRCNLYGLYQVGSGIRAIESLSLAFFKFVRCLYVSLTVDLG